MVISRHKVGYIGHPSIIHTADTVQGASRQVVPDQTVDCGGCYKEHMKVYSITHIPDPEGEAFSHRLPLCGGALWQC